MDYKYKDKRRRNQSKDKRRYSKTQKRRRSRSQRKQRKRHRILSDSRSRSRSYDKSNKHYKSKYKNQLKSSRKYRRYSKGKKQSKYQKQTSMKKNKNPKRSYSSRKQKNSSKKKKETKDSEHFDYYIGQIIKKRYKITDHLGDGTFGRVVEVKDLKYKKYYAMKIIRAVKRYIESAEIETDILYKINKLDKNDKYHICQLYKTFNYKDNYFMIFEQLGLSLYSLIKKNKYRGFNMKYIQSFAQQIFQSCEFMHKNDLTHTDLKPENILLKYDQLKETTIYESKYNDHARSSTRSKSRRSKKQKSRILFEPKYDSIKIIDMGGATWTKDRHSSIINTRQYRSPEVILKCCKWDTKSDVWSIACILLELYTGDLLFNTHDDYQHLAMIEKVCGRIPRWMAEKCNNSLKENFVISQEYLKEKDTYYNWPKNEKNHHKIEDVTYQKRIHDFTQDYYLKDLLKKCLEIDPSDRISCQKALKHPFFEMKYTKHERYQK